MKIALAAALAAGVVASAPVALADDSAPDLRIGQAGTLVNGDVVQTWTISGLRKSGDVIPAQVAGTLWEATATSTAVAGTVIPVIPAFNARAGGANYRVLFAAATAQGINPSTLMQGEKATGKIYFDIDAGTVPDQVVFNDGQADRLVWVNVPEPAAVPPFTPQSTNPAGPQRTTPAAPPAAAGTPPAPSAGAPAATSQGTPAAPSAGTPAATSQGTPATSQGTPAAPPAGTPAAPSAGPPPATSQGPPAGASPPSSSAAPAPAAGTSAGTPANSQGTPAAPGPTGSTAPSTPAAPAIIISPPAAGTAPAS